MLDSYSLPQRGYYRDEEFAFLRDQQDVILTKIADVLKKELPSIEAELSMHELHNHGGQNLCEIASELLHKRLKEAGFVAKILEGDLVIAPEDTLIHQVNIIYAPEHWIVIDLTVDQIEKHKDEHVFVKVVLPNKEALKAMLKEEYNWWFPEER